MASNAQNPICPIGTYIADPTARVWNGGSVYIYGSTDDNLNRWCSYKHDVMYSTNMQMWNFKRDIFSTRGNNDAVEGTDALLFAPDVMYRNNRYYLYFCTPDVDYSEGVAVSLSPLGPFYDSKKINTGGYNEIDPTIFIDDDGQAYYYWGQFSLKGAKMKKDMIELDLGSIKDSILTQKEHYFHEGSFVFKRNDFYYIVYAHEGRRDNRPTCLGYAMSKSPLGPFSYKGVIIDNFGCDPEVWNNHGSVAEFNGQWYVFYHRSSHASKVMRRACVEPIYFNEDGTINEVEMTTQGAGKPISAFFKLEAERACLLGGYCRIMKISEGNEAICSIKNGDFAIYKYIDFSESPSSFVVNLKTYVGGFINVRIDGADGRIIGRIDATNTDNNEYSCEIDNVLGVHSLYLEFIGLEEGTKLFDLDSFRFVK